MSVPGIELVVARFREDLNWIDHVPDGIRVSVYDKSGAAANRIALPNVGREAHTYLHHIVHHYDRLARITVFCQGKPFDHVPEMHRILRRLAGGELAVPDFLWLGFIIDRDDRAGSRLFRTWSKNSGNERLDMDTFCRELLDVNPPDDFVFYPGAHFAVTAECVRRQPLSFYNKALRVSASLPNAAHGFERCWDRVFGVDGIPPAFRGCALPVYLRPVRRLGITWEDVPAGRP